MARLFRHPWHVAVPLGLLLGQGGEFGFLIVNLGIHNGAIPGPAGKFIVLIVTLTMVLTPVAFTKGTDFKPALRPDPATIIHWDTW